MHCMESAADRKAFARLNCRQDIMHLLQAIASHCDQSPNKLALAWFRNRNGDVGRRLTYRELVGAISCTAHSLEDSGIVAGDRAILAYNDGIDFITVFLACLRLGIVPVPVKCPVSSGDAASLLSIAQDCDATVILSDSPEPTVCRSSGRSWRVLRSERVISTTPADWTDLNCFGETVYLQYTSGSTDRPKGAVVTHEGLEHNLSCLRKYSANWLDPWNNVAISWLPHYHDMGLVGKYLNLLRHGGSLYCTSPRAFLANPVGFMRCMGDFGAKICAMPNFALQWILRKSRDERLNLQAMRILFIGAETVHAETLTAFGKKFEPHGLRPSALRPCYGLAESTLFVTGTNTDQWREDGEFVSCGGPVENAQVDIKIVDRVHGAICRDGDVGEVWISSPSNAAGYFERSRLSRDIFNNAISGDDSGRCYLRTGDLAYQQGNQLYICGRAKDVLIIRGMNYFPGELERLVEGSPGVRQNSAVAFSLDTPDGGDLVVVCEPHSPNAVPDVQTLARTLRAGAGISPDVIAVVPPGSVKHTTSGKKKRAICRERWRRGELEPIVQARLGDCSETSNSPVPLNVEHSYLFQYDRNPESLSTLRELGVSSMDMARLAFELNERIQAPDDFDIAMLYELTMRDCYRILCGAVDVDAVLASCYSGRPDTVEQIKSDIALADSYRPVPARFNGLPGNILLTGATGFVGSFLLSRLLWRRSGLVFVLVRSRNSAHARQRIRQSLSRYNLLDRVQEQMHRIRYVSGDLGHQRFGLGESEWLRLADEIDAIIHNGARVNYVLPYGQLRAATVEGTRQALNLAIANGTIPLHYVSSTIVFGWWQGQVMEQDRNADMSHVEFGYAQSKWAAEQLVWQASDRGLPVRVYRPAMLTASADFQFSQDDVITALLAYFVNHRVVIDMPNQISLMPVDFFCDRVMDLAEGTEHSESCFNVVMPYASFPMIAASISKQYGIEFEPLSLAEFADHLKANCRQNDLFFPFVRFYLRHYSDVEKMARKRYDRSNYVRAMSRVGGVRDPVLDSVVRNIMEYFVANRLIFPGREALFQGRSLAGAMAGRTAVGA